MNKRILFLSWKDINHPASGGAELLTDALASYLAETYDVTYFTSSYPGAKPSEHLKGYTIIRQGTLYTTYIYALFWWHWNRAYKNYSCIIDQVHGIPFFSLLYVHHPPVITLVMEVAGGLWDTAYGTCLATIGKTLERLWLSLYRTHTIVTISKSTKDDLVKNTITPQNIFLIPMFSNIQCKNIPQKSENPTLLVVGRIAPVKRIEDAIDAYTIARTSIPALRLVIIGKTERAYKEYTSHIMKKISNDSHIVFIKNASEYEKQTWLEKAHVLLIPSRKEGYGLVILEAASCGTPAIGYSVEGIQDAIINKKTGLLTREPTPASLAQSVCEILHDQEIYVRMQKAAFDYAHSQTKEHTARVFKQIIDARIA